MSTAAKVTSPVARGSSRQLVNKSQLQQFFRGIGSRMELAQTNVAYGSSRPLVLRPELQHFFASVNHRVELAETQQRRIDKRRATGFNVFHLIEPDENKLSDILADLLDPKGDHGQGDLFLRLLFKQLGLGSNPKLTKNATVRREAPTHGILKYRRRMDVFVEAGALLAIENKLDSLEQKDQVKDYLEHLQCCTRGTAKDQIDLSHAGTADPESLKPAVIEEEQAIGKLHCWSYQNDVRDLAGEVPSRLRGAKDSRFPIRLHQLHRICVKTGVRGHSGGRSR